MYYRGAAAAIIVYDISRASTFKTLKSWVDELRNQGPKDIAIAMAGNKADLEDSREVDRAMASAYAEEIGAIYMETSAKDDLNVQDIFIQLSKFRREICALTPCFLPLLFSSLPLLICQANGCLHHPKSTPV